MDETGIKQKNIADALDKSRQNVNDLIRGRTCFTQKTAREWHDAFGFSEAFLLTGRPPIFDDEESAQRWRIPDDLRSIATFRGMQEAQGKQSGKEEEPEDGDGFTAHSALLLPASAYGGSLVGFSDPVPPWQCERISTPVAGDFAMTISGDSMAPDYPNGAMILVRKISATAFIEWGRVYVLDTCNGPVVKVLTPGEKDNCVRCVSLNPSGLFAPFEVNMKDVLGVYRVVMVMANK